MIAGQGKDLPVAPVDATLRAAITVIQEHSAAICLIVDRHQRLVGSLSDGDVRRAFLAGADLGSVALPWAKPHPVRVDVGTDRSAVLDLMHALGIQQIPEVDERGRVTRLHLLREIVGATPLSNAALILAGGRGTRLRSVIGDLPKPMVSVAGRPILERLVLHLVGSGISDIWISVGDRAEVIEGHFGDGEGFGCRIRYVREQEPLGTAGPLRELLRVAALDAPLVVLNGDLVTSFSVSGMLAAHSARQASITVATTEYSHEVPYGVLKVDASRSVLEVEEKPTWIGLVNAGVYAIEPDVVSLVPEGRPVPMTELIEICIDRGEIVSSWPIIGPWHDVGRPADLERARGRSD